MFLVRCTASALRLRLLPVMDPDTDTNHRMIQGQVAPAYGESLDGEWLYVYAPAGLGWAAKRYLGPVNDLPVSSHWPKIPNGLSEIKRVFGEPGNPKCSSGRVKLPEPLKLSWKDETIKEVACHELMEPVWQSVFGTFYTRGWWSLLTSYGGIYEMRPMKNQQKLSTHAWGISVDLNVRGPQDARVVAVFDDHGFQWGGRWKRPDPMHFQWATGY